MYFKISNTAKRRELEEWSNASFKYPKLYKPQIIINGLNEVSIPIVTMEKKEVISLSIWGILPKQYTEDWKIFQNTTNTLNIYKESIDSDLWYAEAFKTRRCLVPVTGFFTSYLRKGEIFPYFISLKNGKPFYIASIYNELEDGFLTNTLIVDKSNEFINKFQNLVNCMPLAVAEEDKDIWLDADTDLDHIKHIMNTPRNYVFHAHPIAKEFFNNDISYDSMLLPYEYSGSNPDRFF